MRSYRKRERLGEKIGIAPKINHYSPFTHCNNFDCKVYLAHNKDFFNAFTKSFVKPIHSKEYWDLFSQHSTKVSHLKAFYCPFCLEEHYYQRPLL